jgi:hypothetical protein
MGFRHEPDDKNGDTSGKGRVEIVRLNRRTNGRNEGSRAMRKLTLKEIDERNSKVKLPEGLLTKGGKVTKEEVESVLITREDGSEVSLAKAVYADLQWLLHSQERAAEREMRKLDELREAGRRLLSPEDFLSIFGRMN